MVKYYYKAETYSNLNGTLSSSISLNLMYLLVLEHHHAGGGGGQISLFFSHKPVQYWPD